MTDTQQSCTALMNSLNEICDLLEDDSAHVINLGLGATFSALLKDVEEIWDTVELIYDSVDEVIH